VKSAGDDICLQFPFSCIAARAFRKGVSLRAFMVIFLFLSESPPAQRVASAAPPRGGLVSERLFHWLCLTHCPAAEHRRTGPIRRANCLTRPRRGVFARPARSRSAGQSEGPRDRAPFLLVRFLWANKENEQSTILPGSVQPLRVLH